MQGTISQHLQGVGSEKDRGAMRAVLEPIGDRVSTHALTSAGLAIKAGGSAVVKTGASAVYAVVKGKLVTKGAATDMAALSGTVTNATFNVYCFFVDVAGTLTSAMGVEATTLAGVRFPSMPEGKALLGFVIINPTGTGNFVGGTTALDDVTVVPNAAYVNCTSPFDPTVIL